MSILHIDMTAIVEVLSFLIFLWLLNTILYRPLSTVFRGRAERIEAGLRAAEESQRQAEEAQRLVRQELDEARARAQRLIAEASKAAEVQRQEAMSRARAEADTILQAAREEITQERQAAIEELRRAIIPLAILAASRVVGDSLDTPANRELAGQAVNDAAAAR